MSAPFGPFTVSVTDPPPEAIISAIGDLDLDTAPALVEAVRSAMESSLDRLVVDLTGVGFVDVCGVNALLAAAHTVALTPVPMVVRAPPSSALRIIDLAELHAVIPLEGNAGHLG